MTLLALQDLFRRHREKSSGSWKIGGEPSRTIFFDVGDIVFAQSTHSTDRLTYLLVERGKLTQAQLDYALANLKPGLSIGKNLIEMGFITQRDLLEVARAQVERVVQGALGTTDQRPVFEAKELDGTVVRLPLDTPQLLLNGLLNLQDRERLLELLGPLNQVVVLQGKRLMEMTLPPDLAKLPPLLDGTHTLLELSRESLAEPLRLGTFALFLREIGWARLHEMPPLDRQALDRALTTELEPLSSPLPEPKVAAVPSLFSTIEAAARPTTNLEHLSRALDSLPEERLPGIGSEPSPSRYTVDSGQALLPSPIVELPDPPLSYADSSGRDIPFHGSSIEIPSVLTQAHPPAPVSKGLLAGLLGAVLLLGLGAWWFIQRLEPVSQAPPPVPPPTVKPVPEVVESAPEPPAAILGTSLRERSETLVRGDLERAIQQGWLFVKEGPAGHWTLRLEIACLGETVSQAVGHFPDGKADLFLLPIALKDGRTCYQVFFGKFSSRQMAERASRSLPRIFHQGGNRPRPFQLKDLPNNQ